MDLVCEENMCNGCYACVERCPKKCIKIEDDVISYNAIIDKTKCINCGLCERICPKQNVQIMRQPIYWQQGWADDSIRRESSSGGAASSIIRAFIKSGGYVASCMFFNGQFGFKVTNNIKEAKKFAGSKYVKSNPRTVYKEITDLLKKEEKVLFIGLPCQSAAVQNVCNNSENLYTVDLICHGTPSPQLLKKYLGENGINIEAISDIKFRDSDNFGLSKDGVRVVPKRVVDSYLMTFLDSITYTENCYSCKFATIKRVSDITLGDAWGQLSDTVKGGVSLVLCQTDKGVELVKQANLHLEDVDLDKAVAANHQLDHPSKIHPSRKKFMKQIKQRRSYRWATFVSIPKKAIKQSVKVGLIKLHLIKDK